MMHQLFTFDVEIERRLQLLVIVNEMGGPFIVKDNSLFV